MAHFIGNVQGGGKLVERLGTKKSGIGAMVGTWTAKVHMRMWQDAHGTDCIRLYVEGDNGVARDFYWGPVADLVRDAGDPDVLVKNYMRRQLTGNEGG